MIGVNSLHSAGRLRSRSLCSVRYGRDFRMMDPFRYPRTPRSRSLKPLVFPDLLGKAQDGQNHPQARKRKRVTLSRITYPFITHLVICTCPWPKKAKKFHRWTMQISFSTFKQIQFTLTLGINGYIMKHLTTVEPFH